MSHSRHVDDIQVEPERSLSSLICLCERLREKEENRNRDKFGIANE